MMARKASVTVVTLVALTGGFRVIKTTLDDLFGLTRGAGDTVRPASCAYGLITLNLIDQILDVDLHRWTPVRGWNMGSHQYTTSSNSTTLESNKSVGLLRIGFPAPHPVTTPTARPSSLKSAMAGGSTRMIRPGSSVFTASRNSMSRRPSTFMPTRVHSSTGFAPQKSSLRDSSTIGRSPVSKSSAPNVSRC